MVIGDVQYVVYMFGYLVIVIFIVMCVVVVEIYIFEGGEVGLFKMFVIVKQCMCLIWSGVGDYQVIFGGFFQWVIFVIDQCWLYVEERMCC